MPKRPWQWLQCAVGNHENNYAQTHRLAPLFPIRCDHCGELFYASTFTKHAPSSSPDPR